MRKTTPVSASLALTFFLASHASIPARAEDHNKPPHAKAQTGHRAVETRQAPGQVQRSTEMVRPGGASVTRSVEVNRAARIVEADTRVVGPRGATLERHVEVERSPYGIEREISSTRPGGASLERSVRVERYPVYIERDSFEYGPAWGIGGPPPAPRSTNFEFFFGPPVMAAPIMPGPVFMGPPVVEVVQPPPMIVAPTPFRTQTAPAVVVDPVNIEVQHLASNHAKSRQDACRNLGRMGDARAVVPLMERLKFDKDTHVREAAAWALGEIGDPRAALYLQRASIYDKKGPVRDEAKKAIARLEFEPSVATQVASSKLNGERPRANASQDPNVSQVKSTGTPVPPPPAPAAEGPVRANTRQSGSAPWPPKDQPMTTTRVPSRGSSSPVSRSTDPAPIVRQDSNDADPLSSPLPALDPPR